MQSTQQFWRKCAALQAQGANQLMEEGLRITRTILKTQSDMVDAAGQFLTEGQRAVMENIEQAGQQGADAVREAGGNGSHGLQQGQKAAQAGSQGSRRAA